LSYAARLQRFRVPLGFVMAALYLTFAPQHATPLTVAVGGTVAFVGLLVRAWAAGHIIKNDQLAVTGPYAHTRNPLYFGSFLIAAGFAIAAHWSLLLLVIAFFVVVYAPTIEREKVHIRSRFPDAYADYERNVPAFVPRPIPWRGAAEKPAPFSSALYMRHGEWRAALGFVAALGYLIIRMRLRA
jgi:protein-S-isoprenylcysteine O-methyltransferase Ste14